MRRQAIHRKLVVTKALHFKSWHRAIIGRGSKKRLRSHSSGESAMRRALIAMALGLWIGVLSGPAVKGANLSAEVLQAIADYPVNPAPVEKLREAGQPALDELFKLRDQLVSARSTGVSRQATAEEEASRTSVLDRRIARLDEIIDQVGKQRYCSRSRLY